MRKRLVLVSGCWLLVAACAPAKHVPTAVGSQASAPVDPALYRTILQQDSALFAAFNGRDMPRFQQHFSPALEVFQDNTGLRNYQQAMTAFGELFKRDYILTRKLVAGSVEVYPIKDYGAIQTGRHTFCHPESGRKECGTFKFVHVWKQETDGWKLVRIITYDHK